MTFTINGIGTRLCGARRIKKEEAEKWADNFPYSLNRTIYDYMVATEAFVFLFIPILPLRTYVYYYTETGAQNGYRIIYCPPHGKEAIYWNHVKSSLSFFIAPTLLLLLILIYISKTIS